MSSWFHPFIKIDNNSLPWLFETAVLVSPSLPKIAVAVRTWSPHAQAAETRSVEVSIRSAGSSASPGAYHVCAQLVTIAVQRVDCDAALPATPLPHHPTLLILQSEQVRFRSTPPPKNPTTVDLCINRVQLATRTGVKVRLSG